MSLSISGPSLLSIPRVTTAEQILVSEGDALPDPGPKHSYLFTGNVSRSWPAQYEYQLYPNTVLVREGSEPPELPEASAHQYVPTGIVHRSQPPQHEYRLVGPTE
jgi:hypothetical protein